MINWLNQNVQIAEWITALVAAVATFFAIREFFWKRRPFIDIEIQVAENPNKEQGGWMFFGLLINKGTYPGVVHVDKTVMKVGDESYPSDVRNNMFVSPGESKKTALIGSIYGIGIKKVINHEYRSNRVEIEMVVSSAPIGARRMKYKTHVLYEVNVTGDKPVISLIEESYT